MPQKDYRSYAKSPRGLAARARAHAKYVERRKALREMNRPPSFNPGPLSQAISTWSRPQ